MNCAGKFVLAALAAPADDTKIRASTIGHEEIQQAVAFAIGNAVMKAGPDWAASVAGGKMELGKKPRSNCAQLALLWKKSEGSGNRTCAKKACVTATAQCVP